MLKSFLIVFGITVGAITAFAETRTNVGTVGAEPSNPGTQPPAADHSLTPTPNTTTKVDPLEKFQKDVSTDSVVTSKDIREAQEQLVSKGFQVNIDGRMGPATAKAIRSVQAKNGLRTTGVLDEATIKVLKQ